MTKQEKIDKLNKFYSDPDWVLVEEMIHEYIDSLKDVTKIDTKRSNDEVSAEIRGRQISYERLTRFLTDCKLLTRIKEKSFR